MTGDQKRGRALGFMYSPPNRAMSLSASSFVAKHLTT
jgi:hypothetical protein